MSQQESSLEHPLGITPAKHYCIRSDYIARSESTTLEHDATGSYWTPTRLDASLAYQFDVYRIAYQIAASHKGPVRILDVGCGPARKHNGFSGTNVAGVTLVDQPSVKAIAAKYLPSAVFHEVDLEVAEVDLGRQFDIVVCADVVEHLINPDPCLACIMAHTKKDGVALISTPDRERLYGPGLLQSGHERHVREWNYDEFARYLRSRRFRIRQHRIVHQQRSALLRRILDPVLDRFGVFVPSYSCQLAICTVVDR